MQKNLLWGILCSVALLGYAQNDPVLMTIDNEPIRVSEFMYIYQKNNTDDFVERKTIDEYVELFTNFKLKVHAAEQLGYDTTASFRQEFEQYRAQATPPYMTDSAAIDSLVRLSYAHMAEDRRAAHIVVACPRDASDSVREAALAKITELRQRVTTGLPKIVGKGKKAKTVYEKENFLEVAQAYSEDPALSQNGGELGWIVPFRYVYSFEEAVYNTPVDSVTPIFQSPFGYHIALVEEAKPHREVSAAHIMKMVRRGDEQSDVAAKAQIDSIYQLILAGADFAETARALSDDKGSAMQGGDLGWFGQGVMVKAFEDQAFTLNDGEISEPFKSNYGWHIIYKKGARSVQPLDSAYYAAILKNVKRDERFKEVAKSFARKARAEYNLPDTMPDVEVEAYANRHLEEKYPDFANLVREYHDGILLFDISLTEVWDKAAQDTAGLQAYFAAHKKEYTWDNPHYKGYYIQASTPAAAKAAKKIVQNCMKREPDSVQSYIQHRINIDSIPAVKVKQGLWERGRNLAIDVLAFGVKDTTYSPSEEYPFATVVGKSLKKPECYEDVKSSVVVDYQDELEREWIVRLREQYPVVIDEQVLEAIK